MKILLLLLTLVLTQVVVMAHTQTNDDALFPVEVKGKHGYINSAGRMIIRPRFDDAWPFSEGLAPVAIEDKWGFIDQTGKIVIAPQFFEVTPFQEGLACVGKFYEHGPINDEIGDYVYIDRKGNFVFQMHFGVAFSFSNGLARIKAKDYRDGYLDKTGKVVFWDERFGEDFSNDLGLFKTDGNMSDSRVGYFDRMGRVVIEPKFIAGHNFAEGLACVRDGDKSGFINTKGQVAIDFRFAGCDDFSEGLAPVLINDKWGYIDKAGKVVIEPKFDEAETFSDGVAVVMIAKPKTAKTSFSQDFITETKNGLYGVVDRNGNLIVPAEFRQIGQFSHGLAWVNLSEYFLVHGNTSKWGYLNKNGEVIWKSFKETRTERIAAEREAGRQKAEAVTAVNR